MLKNHLRKEYKQKRMNLTAEELLSLNAALQVQLDQLDLSEVQFCHIFLPIQKFNEPDTFAMMSVLKHKYPQIQWVISRSGKTNNSMESVLWEDALHIKENDWGIPEPEGGKKIADEHIDAVFVPMLICDTKGNRVGYGKGFYDRFLANCKKDVLTIGLSFFDPVSDIEDVDENDIPLQYCVTPNAVHAF